MGRLLPLSWQEIDRALEHFGARYQRTKGDHRIHRKDGLRRPLPYPMDDCVADFVVRNLMRELGVSPDEFVAAAKGRATVREMIEGALYRRSENDPFWHSQQTCPSWPKGAAFEESATQDGGLPCPDCLKVAEPPVH